MKARTGETERALRRRAEKVLRKKVAQQQLELKEMSPEDLREAFHELQVHQIELQLQNEELQRAQLALDQARAHYFDLYDQAPIGYCTLNAKGLVTEANQTVATLLGVAQVELLERPISHFIFKQDQDIYYLFSKSLFKSVATVQRHQEQIGGEQPSESPACELRMVRKDKTTFWAHLKMSAVHRAQTGGSKTSRFRCSTETDSESGKPAAHGRLHRPPLQQPAVCRVGQPGDGP
jgi:PAS domain-containing protein